MTQAENHNPLSEENVLNALPSKEEEARHLEHMTKMFDDTARSGAGGVKSGSTGIFPNGMKAASDFIDDMTPGKYKAPPPTGTTPVFSAETRRNLEKKCQAMGLPTPAIMLPHNFCTDCNKTDVTWELGAMDLWMLHESHISLYEIPRVKPFDLIVSFQCNPCYRKAFDATQKRQSDGLIAENINPLTLVELDEFGNPSETTVEAMQLRQRPVRLQTNIAAYIKTEAIKPDSPIFFTSVLTYAKN